MPETKDATWYHVKIEFHEPEFELRIGRSGPPYSASYDFLAVDHAEAARLAVATFKLDAQVSGVGWRRVIHRLTVEPLTEAEQPDHGIV